MKAVWLGLGASLAVALIACSSDDTSSKFPDTASFCNQFAQEECQVASRCAAPPATCQSSRQSACQQLASASATGTRAYQPGNAQACIDKLHEVYGNASNGSAITPDQQNQISDVCSRVFSGTVDKGGACTTSYDCKDGRICDKNVCADQNTKNQGDFCGNPGETCASGSYCTAAGGGLQCVADGAQGAACDPTKPCAPDLRCDNTCGPRFQAGTLCASNADCASSAPFCDPYIGNKCDSGITFAAGAPACKDYGGS